MCQRSASPLFCLCLDDCEPAGDRPGVLVDLTIDVSGHTVVNILPWQWATSAIAPVWHVPGEKGSGPGVDKRLCADSLRPRGARDEDRCQVAAV
ncbi:hypothetical protein [Streptomyces sp. NPDC001933]|uniref:hypothetical protein n=1 Tax=Streptomyces sp. NPDC001933 TaxID=3364626 RepID=UPI00368D8054